MDAFDLDVRRHVYFSVVANGRPPTTVETAGAFDLPEPEIAAAYRRLHDAHALVLFPDTTDVWMANPFCFAPTAHSVAAGGRTWTLRPHGSLGGGRWPDLDRHLCVGRTRDPGSAPLRRSDRVRVRMLQ